MIQRDRTRQIFVLSLPIIGGMVSQNILNLVDAAMVGFLGAASLAAVGIASFINFMAVAFFTGFAAGVQALVSRRMGQGRHEEAAWPLNGAILMIVIAALPVTLLLIFAAPWIMEVMLDDPAVVEAGTPYLQARFAGIIAIGLNFSFRGYWSGIKKTGLYLRTLLLMHSLNIVLNYMLIFGKFGFPALGTFGAGLGTTIALCLGAVYYFYLAGKHTRDFGFMGKLPTAATLGALVRISMPASIQQLFFAGGFTLLFWIIGKVGTYELAAVNAITNIMLVAILPCIGFGLGAATLVGQALGREEPADAWRWGWEVAWIACGVGIFMGLPILLFPDLILGIFLHNPEAIEIGRNPLRLSAAAFAIDAIGLVLLNALNGAGATKSTMLVTLSLQWLLFLPIAWILGPGIGLGFAAIWLAYVIYRAIQTGFFVWLWNRRTWTEISTA